VPADLRKVRPAAVYRVAIRVDNEVAEEWLEWMRTVHVPEVLDTGCFTGCTISRQVEPVDVGSRRSFVLEYGLASVELFEQYQSRHAAGRFEASRSISTLVDQLSPASE
jgi:hypothetical protein